MYLPAKVHLLDVTLRDGLQNEPIYVPTEEKLRVLEKLIGAGFKRIEVTSFVHPGWIPTLRDADEFVKHIPIRGDVEYQALVPNKRGLERFLNSPIENAVFFLSASTAHNEANVNRTTDQSLDEIVDLIKYARREGRQAVGAIATSFVCPFTGIVPFQDVVRIAERLVESGAKELAIADTIGQATPKMIFDRCSALSRRFPSVEISLHLHDSHGYGLANVLAALQCGIKWFDVSQAGLGGCPYAPGAPGNLQASKVVEFLEKQGISTELDEPLLVELDCYLKTLME
jgi:hydroxymethylglutaryl-CoA lyase